MKTITVKDQTWEALTKLKLQLRHTTLDNTVGYLLYELNYYNQEVEKQNGNVKERK